jgi:hypothetical protein
VALRDEIFHPFFTTKTDGCGIGIPAALRAVRENGGDLYLSQRPDGAPGACFVVLFPLALPNETGVSTDLRANPAPAPRAGWRKPGTEKLRWARVSDGSTRPAEDLSAPTAMP